MVSLVSEHTHTPTAVTKAKLYTSTPPGEHDNPDWSFSFDPEASWEKRSPLDYRNKCGDTLLPLLIRCFSPDRIPGVSMMLML